MIAYAVLFSPHVFPFPLLDDLAAFACIIILAIDVVPPRKLSTQGEEPRRHSITVCESPSNPPPTKSPVAESAFELAARTMAEVKARIQRVARFGDLDISNQPVSRSLLNLAQNFTCNNLIHDKSSLAVGGGWLYTGTLDLPVAIY